jgi:hypothetical protein
MIRSLQLIVCTVALSSGGPALDLFAQTGSSWLDPHETDDSISVSSREVPDSGVLELRAVCMADAAPWIVFRAAMRRDTYRHTSKYVVDYRIINTEYSNVWYTYQRLSIPLIMDRDYTLRYEATQDSLNGRYSLVWTTANDKGPPPGEDVVRIEVSRGALEMVPEENGTKTRLIYTMYADPGGTIPGWLANIGNRSTVPDLLRAIRDASAARETRGVRMDSDKCDP